VRDIDYEVWVANELAEFIRFQIRGRLPEGFSFGDTLNFWLQQFTLRVNFKSACALGAKDTALKTWAFNGAIPRLRMTLNLCWVFGVSLLDFLHVRIPPNHDGRLREPIDRRERFASPSRRSRINREAMRAELLSILKDNRYAMMPFAEICRKKLNRRDMVIRQTFPVEARAIAQRFLENRRLIAEAIPMFGVLAAARKDRSALHRPGWRQARHLDHIRFSGGLCRPGSPGRMQARGGSNEAQP
jgi:hypothetical protein